MFKKSTVVIESKKFKVKSFYQFSFTNVLEIYLHYFFNFQLHFFQIWAQSIYVGIDHQQSWFYFWPKFISIYKLNRCLKILKKSQVGTHQTFVITQIEPFRSIRRIRFPYYSIDGEPKRDLKNEKILNIFFIII